ncbi:MAG TPA: hypothetical protein VFI25_03880 [Planctomycetota bacterium]|nr:hypothetical protein [Planctomycetota bacterium]
MRASYAARVEGVKRVEEAEPSPGSESLGVPDAEGYRLFEGLAWGEYEVRVDGGQWTGRQTVAVEPGGTASVEVTLTAKR